AAMRRQPSCRCRSEPGQARRGRPAAAGWSRPGSARAIRSRRRPAHAAGVRAGRDRRNRRQAWRRGAGHSSCTVYAASMKAMEALRFDNAFVRELPGDPETGTRLREVEGALWSEVLPTPVAAPRLLAWTPDLAE